MIPATGGSNPPAPINYYSTVNAATLRTIGDPDPSFTTAETWDCQAPSGTSFSEANAKNFPAAVTTGMQTCNTTYGFDDQKWTDCRSADYSTGN